MKQNIEELLFRLYGWYCRNKTAVSYIAVAVVMYIAMRLLGKS
jgi:hypothetical protein